MQSEAFSGREISIHALREEGDWAVRPAKSWPKHFYPRPPRGGRPKPAEERKETEIFLSTPSARRATEPEAEEAPYSEISIHALREEGDRKPPTV